MFFFRFLKKRLGGSTTQLSFFLLQTKIVTEICLLVAFNVYYQNIIVRLQSLFL